MVRVAPDGKDSSPSPLQVVLVDRQTRLGPKGSIRFYRYIRAVNEAAALGNASQIEVEFDPTFQKLVWHRAEIVRGTQRIDRLNRGMIQLLRRETKLERQMYDGRVTASIVLPDVRVGDHIEWSYSLEGDNPVFGGKFVETDLTVSSRGPISLYQYRLISPTSRVIHHRADEATVTVQSQTVGTDREIVLRHLSAPQFATDFYTPPSVLISSMIQLSEFKDWASVAAWAKSLFDEAASGSVEVSQAAATIGSGPGDVANRVRRTLDFVQREIRYFGTEMNEARRSFQRSIDTGIVEFSEFVLARRELARLQP